jgi:hypothetical protein
METNEIQNLTPEQVVLRWVNVGIRVSVRTLRYWRKTNSGPAWIKIGGQIYYPLDFVEEYEQDNTHIPKK